jgi:hypothetical protein
MNSKVIIEWYKDPCHRGILSFCLLAISVFAFFKADDGAGLLLIAENAMRCE